MPSHDSKPVVHNTISPARRGEEATGRVIRALARLAVLCVAVFLATTSAATASRVDVAPLPAVSPKPASAPVLPVTLSPLEQELFADATDGRLDEHSLLWASLVAGGVNDGARIEQYQRRVDALVDQWRKSAAMTGPARRRAQAAFERMHSEVLHAGYQIDATELTTVLDRGRFNCVSASVLYCYLGERLGLDVRGLELPGHAMSRLHLDGQTIDVESTCPRWFRLIGDPRRQAELVAEVSGLQPGKGGADQRREVSGPGLVATIYYNRGVDLLREKRFAEAAEANTKALWLDPSSATARGNLLATLNNWAIHEGGLRCYNEAIGLLRAGLTLQSDFRPFHVNFAHVHRQWSEELCRAGQYEQSCAVLLAGRRDLADEPWFERMLSDVYRRWATSLLDAQQIDQAFAVLDAARRSQGGIETLPWEVETIRRHVAKLADQGRDDEALALLDRALARHPDSSVLADRRRGIQSQQAKPIDVRVGRPAELSWLPEHFVSDIADEPADESGDAL